jgi:hypothetical protein
MKKAKHAAAKKQFKKLEKAVQVFQKAVIEFGKVYSPETVSLDGWIGEFDDVMFDIDQEIQGDE